LVATRGEREVGNAVLTAAGILFSTIAFLELMAGIQNGTNSRSVCLLSERIVGDRKIKYEHIVKVIFQGSVSKYFNLNASLL
jgi:hypothetical protein